MGAWAFWRDALERAVRTTAQTAAGMLLGHSVGLLGVNWGSVSSIAGMAGVLSLLLSVGGEAARPTGTASLIDPHKGGQFP